jgi:hypothetical protein
LKMASPRQTKGKTMISIEKRLSYLVKWNSAIWKQHLWWKWKNESYLQDGID